MDKKKAIELVTLVMIMVMVGYVCVRLGADIKRQAESLTQNHYEQYVDIEDEEKVPLGEPAN